MCELSGPDIIADMAENVETPTIRTFYSIALAKDICHRMAGGESLRQICEPDEMPDRSTVYQWTRTHLDFRDALSAARDAHADMLADEVVYIADTVRDAQRARNMIEARKWFAGVIRPKQYGNKIDINVTETISIDSARSAALARLKQSVSDHAVLKHVQAVDLNDNVAEGSPDYKSDDPDV